jgi:hypothetical protein
MSDHFENNIQPSEAVPPQGLRESLLVELETARQAIAELSSEQLEEIVGGGLGLGCFGCGKPETISPPESPRPSRSFKFALETLDALSPSREPSLERTTSSPARFQNSPFQAYPKDRQLKKLSSQVKELMPQLWKATRD